MGHPLTVRGRYAPSISTTGTWIVTTAIVSHFIVEGGASPFPGMVDADPAVAVEYQSRFFMHYVIPAMVLFDWIVFGPHGIVRWRDTLWWLLFPLAYGVISILRGQWFPDVSDRFPYPFFDPTISGWGGVALGMAQVLLANAVIAAGIIGLDRLSAMVARRRNAPHGEVRVESGDQHRSGITGELPEEQGARPQ